MVSSLIFQFGFLLFLCLLWLPWLGLPKLCWIVLARVTFYNEVSPHISQNGHHQIHLYIINSGDGVEKREPSNTGDRNVNLQSYEEQHGGSLKTKYKTTIWTSNPTPGHIPRGSDNSKRYITPMFSSVTQLCPTFYNPMDCSTPGLPIHH